MSQRNEVQIPSEVKPVKELNKDNYITWSQSNPLNTNSNYDQTRNQGGKLITEMNSSKPLSVNASKSINSKSNLMSKSRKTMHRDRMLAQLYQDHIDPNSIITKSIKTPSETGKELVPAGFYSDQEDA